MEFTDTGKVISINSFRNQKIAGIFLSVLLPPIGLILGIIWLLDRRPGFRRLGSYVTILSILSGAFLAALLVSGAFPDRRSIADEWWLGGDLLNRSLVEWNQAGYTEKLASCGELVIAMNPDLDLATKRGNRLLFRKSNRLVRQLDDLVRTSDGIEDLAMPVGTIAAMTLAMEQSGYLLPE